MTRDVTYDDIKAYEAKRAAVKANYAARLKNLSAANPEYKRLWDERITALADLAAAYGIPAGTER